MFQITRSQRLLKRVMGKIEMLATEKILES